MNPRRQKYHFTVLEKKRKLNLYKFSIDRGIIVFSIVLNSIKELTFPRNKINSIYFPPSQRKPSSQLSTHCTHTFFPPLTCIGLLFESKDVIVNRGLLLPFNVSQSVSALKYVFEGTLLVHFQMFVINRLYV